MQVTICDICEIKGDLSSTNLLNDKVDLCQPCFAKVAQYIKKLKELAHTVCYEEK